MRTPSSINFSEKVEEFELSQDSLDMTESARRREKNKYRPKSYGELKYMHLHKEKLN